MPLGEVLIKSREQVDIDPHEQYKQVTIKLWGQGVVLRDEVDGSSIAGAKRFVVRPKQFILSRIDARNGAFGLVPDFLDGAVVSNDFPTFAPNSSRVLPAFLGWMSKTRGFVDLCRAASEGTTNRVRLKENLFMAMKIPLPPLSEQQRIVARIEELAARIEEARGLRRQAMEEARVLAERAAATLLGSDWPVAALDDLLREPSRNGLAPRPSDTPPGTPILRISAATSRDDAIVDETDVRYLQVSEGDEVKYKLEPGDLLACRFNGNLNYVGRFALYSGTSSEARVYPDKLIRFRLDTEKALPEFVVAPH